ncbi:hypothetical protein KAOT1_08869 [Kordia algicida OT-1]|uniref:Uncharacterized protein n=1 Tax=Kordia algicida OT-1 TaxID=391587 RepID=A9E7M5_9FLAO|nr:hypothetical protein KAOT1_08869 [Kordia algicida OT-1]
MILNNKVIVNAPKNEEIKLVISAALVAGKNDKTTLQRIV